MLMPKVAAEDAAGRAGQVRCRGGGRETRSFQGTLAVVCVCVFFVTMGISFFVPAFFGSAWRGYYTVLVDSDADIGEISGALRERGFEDFLSAHSAALEFSDFDAREKISVHDLPRRLLPEDPRMDEFLRGALSLFRGASGRSHILYVPAREGPFTLGWKLGGALKGISWSMVEWSAGRRLVLLFLFCAFAGFQAYFNPGLRLAALALALPWLSFLVHGNPGVFAAGLLVYFAFVYCAKEAASRFDDYVYACGGGGFRTRGFCLRALAGGVLVCAAVLLAVFCGGAAGAFIPLACGLVGSFALTVLLALHRRRLRTRREHRLFVPLAILPGRWKAKTRGRADLVLLALVCCLLAVPLAFRLSGGLSELIPRPRAAAGISGFSRESLRQLWAQDPGGLPDFSDYLCHRAFQEGFFYGYPQVFPLPGDRLSLPRYREENGVILRTEETLLTFDEIWYKKELEKAEEPGIANLLLRQGVSGISLQPASRVYVDSSWVLRYALLSALGLLPFLLMAAGGVGTPASFMKTFKYRRNEQEA
jgi:hypothetical protein